MRWDATVVIIQPTKSFLQPTIIFQSNFKYFFLNFAKKGGLLDHLGQFQTYRVDSYSCHPLISLYARMKKNNIGQSPELATPKFTKVLDSVNFVGWQGLDSCHFQRVDSSRLGCFFSILKHREIRGWQEQQSTLYIKKKTVYIKKIYIFSLKNISRISFFGSSYSLLKSFLHPSILFQSWFQVHIFKVCKTGGLWQHWGHLKAYFQQNSYFVLNLGLLAHCGGAGALWAQ